MKKTKGAWGRKHRYKASGRDREQDTGDTHEGNHQPGGEGA